jgi:hypothetical protein
MSREGKGLVMVSIILFSIIVFSNCQPSQPVNKFDPRATPTTTTSATSPEGAEKTGIHSVDFKNFSYDWYLPEYRSKSHEQIILKDGSMGVELAPGKEPREFYLIEVRYGDLTTDGNEEAVVILGVITSGTARHSLVFVYGMSGETPKRLFVYETGDRWDYGYHDASIRNRQLVIERYKPVIIEDRGKKHDMSSSDTYIRDYYEWDHTKFVKVKTEEVPADREDKNPWVSHDRS